jgi:hypothetical protein
MKLQDQPSAVPERQYPAFLELIGEGRDSGDLSAALPVQPPAPVPGTFFPAPRVPRERSDRGVERMLATMAKGLSIGGDDDGRRDIWITLSDDHFAGTELRISNIHGQIHAEICPTDRDGYFALSSRVDELRDRLRSRGLSVAAVVVKKP